MKLKIINVAACMALLLPAVSNAQFSLEKGAHTFEIGGDIITGYNYRFYQPSEQGDYHKSTFLLDEARFYFKGRVNTQMQYKFEMDLADLAADVQTPSSSLGFLKDANVEYNTSIIGIKAGYQKLPYGYNARIAEIDDPFLQRPSIASKVNNRRDMGVTLSHWFPYWRVTMYGGVYTGMGEQTFSTDNKNGKPEYIGRIEYSYPARNTDQIVDYHDSPMPTFQFGANARYKEGTLTTIDDYSLLTVNGKKTSYGADASVAYKGISFQIEAHQLHVVPLDSSRLYAQGKTYSYFKAGGYLAELNYYSKKMKSIFAVRYDELNPTDLTYGNTQKTITYCYNYLIQQNTICLKLQYEQHLDQKYPANTRWKDDEIKAMIQVLFN